MTDAKNPGKLSSRTRTPSLWLVLAGLLVGGCADVDSEGDQGESFGSAGPGSGAADDPGAVDTDAAEEDDAVGTTGGAEGETGAATWPDTDGRDPGRQGTSTGSSSYDSTDSYGESGTAQTTGAESGSTTGDDPGEPHCCTGLPSVTCDEEPGCEWQGGKDPGCRSICEGEGQNLCTQNPLCFWVGTEARICAPGGDDGPIDCSNSDQGS